MSVNSLNPKDLAAVQASKGLSALLRDAALYRAALYRLASACLVMREAGFIDPAVAESVGVPGRHPSAEQAVEALVDAVLLGAITEDRERENR